MARPSRKAIMDALASTPWSSVEEGARALGVSAGQIHRALRSGIRARTGAATVVALERLGLRGLCDDLTGVAVVGE